MTRLLLIDDDKELSAMLGEYLTTEGIDIEHAYNGKQGIEKALAEDFDAIVLDVMMPGLDGFEVLRRLRIESSVPILMLTAKGDDVDRIVGLEIGADDYLPKPFNPRELLARLRAVLRRTQASPHQVDNEQVLQIGLLELIPASRSALVAGKPLDLTSTEFNLLLTLIKQAGKVVSKETLSELSMGRKLEKYDRSIDMHMSNLRKKMAQSGVGEMIITVRGQGYQLSAAN